MIEFCEGVIHRKNFKISPFRELNDKLIVLRQKYEDENIDVMPLLVKLIMNSLYGEQIRKYIEESCQCKSDVDRIC